MKKISLDKIIIDNSSIDDILVEYEKLKIMIKDSDIKLKELKNYLSDNTIKEYKHLRESNSNLLFTFLLDNPMLSEYIDEKKYNKLLYSKLELLLKQKLDLSKLSNGIVCQHEFVTLNNSFMCIKCFIKEDDLDFDNEDIRDLLVDAALFQGMYIDELDESELGLLEMVKAEHKALIENLKQKKASLSKEDQANVDETINSLEKNKTLEYRKSLRNLRKEKLSIK